MFDNVPDVMGIYAALAELPDRTPDQLRGYAVAQSARLGAERLDTADEDELFDEAVGYVMDQLAELKLTKKVREQISDALNRDWPS